MSLEFVDGFDHYQAVWQKWDAAVDMAGNAAYEYPTINPSFGRNSGGCLHVGATANNTSTSAAFVQKNLTDIATRYVGFALWINLTSLGGDVVLLRYKDGTSIQVDLRIDVTGHFYFTRNGTLLGSKSTNAYPGSQWHYVEIAVTINSSTGSAQLKVDTVSWLNLTSQNTQASGNAFAGAIVIGAGTVNGASQNAVFYDDLYILNTNGSLNNTFLGDTKVQGVLPTANGTTLNYTPVAASWVANTRMNTGRSVKDTNNNIQRVTAVTSTALTGGSAPSWNVTLGGTTTDNNVTWTNIGASTDYLYVNQNPPEGTSQRKTNTAYTVGQAIWDPNGFIQICTTAGTTTIFEIGQNGWNTTVGGTTVGDGSVVWTNIGLIEDLYLSDSNVGDISRFTFPAIPATTVFAAVTTIRARKDDAGPRSIRGATKSTGTVGDSGTDLPLSTNYSYLQGIFETDPHTSAAWTPTALNAAEFGIKTTV